MNITSLIQSFATATSYTVTRKTRGATVRGRVGDGTTSTLTITASVVPASDRDLLRLPEGRRIKQARTVFTSTMLEIGGQGAAYEADTISIEGSSWEVSMQETWTDSLSRSVGYRYVVTEVA